MDFVGSRTAPYVVPGFTSARYLDPNFDRSHFAQGGTLLQQQAGRIGQEVRAQNPGTIILAFGVNDLRHGATPAQTDQHLRAWIGAARAQPSRPCES